MLQRTKRKTHLIRAHAFLFAVWSLAASGGWHKYLWDKLIVDIIVGIIKQMQVIWRQAILRSEEEEIEFCLHWLLLVSRCSGLFPPAEHKSCYLKTPLEWRFVFSLNNMICFSNKERANISSVWLKSIQLIIPEKIFTWVLRKMIW